MLAVTDILSCVIKIRGIFKSTKWRDFENVKFEALSARRVLALIVFRIPFLIGGLYFTVANMKNYSYLQTISYDVIILIHYSQV